MVPSTIQMPRKWIFVHWFNYLETQISHLHDHHFCPSSELCSGDQRRRRQRRFRRQQMCLHDGSSLPLRRHNYSPLHCLVDRSHSEVSYTLSHTFAQSLKYVIQEALQVLSYMELDSRVFFRVSAVDARIEEDIDNYETDHNEEHAFVPFSHLVHLYPCCNFDVSRGEVPSRRLHYSMLSPQSSLLRMMPILNYRGFSGVPDGKAETVEEKEQTWDDDGDEGENESGESQADGVISVTDVKEVESVCKVIEELFTSDRNIEAVLDQRGIDLPHDLVLDVLAWFRLAGRPAFWSWAGRRPGFLHHSGKYDSMMGILGKTRQFESMVMMLEEMRNKGLLTIETLSLAIRVIAAWKISSSSL
ncbi:hypothetical protein NE237_014914 [Protea cynaroides]|uniref:Pentatricopeptide repeat-containing protein n=1 Tax=Protea cynaroides TaxID=273540 RepID=A0A9Q0KCW8_9MAGN|nr:hypothetical protein NE237_014914 [Protea cynaroides]